MLSKNLIKQYNAVGAGETRIIDNNELLRRRGEGSPVVKVAQPDSDGFISGLNAEEIVLPPEMDGISESNVIKAHEDIQGMLDQARGEAQTIRDQAKGEAEAILVQARREAASLIEEAKAQAESQKKSITDQARQQGYVDGQVKAQAEVDVARKEFQEKVRQIEEEYQQQLDEIEPKFVDTITAIYEHLFHVELGSNREVLGYLISNTMHKLEGGGNFLIRVSKEDYSYVTSQKEQLLAGTASGIGTVEIVEDLTLGKNDCLIETDSGIFDCGLDTQLAGLREKLMLLAWSRDESPS